MSSGPSTATWPTPSHESSSSSLAAVAAMSRVAQLGSLRSPAIGAKKMPPFLIGSAKRRMLAQLSDLDQLLWSGWPGHDVDDASLTWRRCGRRAAGSVTGSGVPGVPAQREQLAVGGRELGLGFGQFAAQLSQPCSEGGDHAGGVAAGFTRRSMSGGCGLLAAEPFDAGRQLGVAVEEVHRDAAGC